MPLLHTVQCAVLSTGLVLVHASLASNHACAPRLVLGTLCGSPGGLVEQLVCVFLLFRQFMLEVSCVAKQQRVAVFLPPQKHPEPFRHKRQPPIAKGALRSGEERATRSNPRQNASRGDAHAPHQRGHARGNVLVPAAGRVKCQTPVLDAVSVSVVVSTCVTSTVSLPRQATRDTRSQACGSCLHSNVSAAGRRAAWLWRAGR